MSVAEGERKLKTHQISGLLNTELGSTSFASMEDPLEDVFISNVATDEGNFRIFEGIWESSDFILQRIINVVKTLPASRECSQLRREITAALKLSEEIANRRKLARFSAGSGHDKRRIDVPSLERLETLRRAITFCDDDLNRLGISSSDLSPFIFAPRNADRLKDQMLSDSELHRRPIFLFEETWFVLMPSAISVAIREHILEWMNFRGYNNSFDQHLAEEYSHFLTETPFLGSRFPREVQLPHRKVGCRTVLEFATQIDTGRYVQAIAIVEGIDSFIKHGFFTPDHDISELIQKVSSAIDASRVYFREQAGFKQALTLVIGCGYGRPLLFGLPEETPDWRIEMIPAADLSILARVAGATPLFLWKLVDHERFLAENNILIHNANGLLNLYGWWSDTNYLMLHPAIEFGAERVMVSIPTDCLAEIRRKVRQEWDEHALTLPTGRCVRVCRDSVDSYFPDESEKSQYACLDALLEGELLGAHVGERSVWWISAELGDTGLSRDLIFRIWDAVKKWLMRAAPILEQRIQDLAGRNLLLVLDFGEAKDEQAKLNDNELLRSFISITPDNRNGTIRLSFRDPFFGGFRNPKNLAEREIIRAIASGCFIIAGMEPNENKLDALINEIVPNEDARYVHFFEVINFRDYIQLYDEPTELLIDKSDEARSKLGLGWLVQNRKDGDRFKTAGESVAFLNRVVEVVWKRMQSRLHSLDRANLIKKALWHLEGVEIEKKRWRRTIRAMLALQGDKATTKSIAVEQVAHCNAGEIALRLVIEMAVSECPRKGGEAVGSLDLAPLLADVLMIFHFGGCSDAIKKGVMEPEVRIAPCGDVLVHTGFMDEIARPLGEYFESALLDHEAMRYEKYFEHSRDVVNMQELFTPDFLEAFNDEFGLSLDELRSSQQGLVDLAIQKKKCVFAAQKDEIFAHFKSGGLITASVGKVFLDQFSLWPRKSWDKTPEGFEPKDWYPWRFGRRLSLVARPIVRIENNGNPAYLISPGLMGLGIAWTVSRYFEGEVEESQCGSPAMRRWIGEKKNLKGHKFADNVFKRVKSLGYEALLEKKVSTLLNMKLEKDWGDVDVLAWKKNEDVVLAIECKDLKMAKTANEIAEQLTNFSGQLSHDGEPDDLLRHLNRIELLREHSHLLAREIGIGNRSVQIKTVVCFSKPVPMKFVEKRFPNVLFRIVDDFSENLT